MTQGIINLSMLTVLTSVVALIVIWVIVSIPVWLAAKVVTRGSAKFTSAMATTLLGPVIYGIVFLGASFFLGFVVGPVAVALASILAFIAWLGVYKSVFSTGWLGALGIAILAVIVFYALTLVFGLMMPRNLFPAQFI